jgi:hypothetical protein
MSRPTCRNCGATSGLSWAKTRTGKAMLIEPGLPPGPPANLTVHPLGDREFSVLVVKPGTGTHRPHFATCQLLAKKIRKGASNEQD